MYPGLASIYELYGRPIHAVRILPGNLVSIADREAPNGGMVAHPCAGLYSRVMKTSHPEKCSQVLLITEDAKSCQLMIRSWKPGFSPSHKTISVFKFRVSYVGIDRKVNTHEGMNPHFGNPGPDIHLPNLEDISFKSGKQFGRWERHFEGVEVRVGVIDGGAEEVRVRDI